MRSLTHIKIEIEQLTERRRGLLEALSQAHDAALVQERTELEERLAALWQEQRLVRAHMRFGDRDQIIKRARAEERLDRAA